ncbi:hypothetical protein Zm00014a_028563, partial [Zea mays]
VLAADLPSSASAVSPISHLLIPSAPTAPHSLWVAHQLHTSDLLGLCSIRFLPSPITHFHLSQISQRIGSVLSFYFPQFLHFPSFYSLLRSGSADKSTRK